MNRFSTAVLVGFAAIFAIGCGGSKDLGIKDGDKLVLNERLERQRFEASYGENANNIDHTDGDFIEIPEKTVFEVFVTPRKEAKTIELRIVKAPIRVADASGAIIERESEDYNELTVYFVQERFRTYDFLDYTITVPAEYLGTKLTKLQ